MEFTLLQDGADSFKKAKASIESYEQVVEEYSSHHLKDAVLSLSHSIEIFFKYMLSEKSEYLIFSDLTKLTEATKQLTEYQKKTTKVPINGGFGYRKKYYRSVFDVPKGRNLRTIGLGEAKERVKYLCGISIPDDLEQGIIKIQSYRNQLTHNTINMDTFEKVELISSLKVLHENTRNFFESNILNFNLTYVEQRFEISKEEYENHRIDMEAYYQEVAIVMSEEQREFEMAMKMAEEELLQNEMSKMMAEEEQHENAMDEQQQRYEVAMVMAEEEQLQNEMSRMMAEEQRHEDAMAQEQQEYEMERAKDYYDEMETTVEMD